MKRLIRKADHDIDNRDFAILYVDGQLIEGRSHKEALDKYLLSKQQAPLEGEVGHYIWDDLSKYSEQGMAFLHYARDYRLDENGELTDEPAIFLSDNHGVPVSEVVQAIKNQYPGVPIYDDIEGDYIDAPKNNLGVSGPLYQYDTRLD